MSHGTFAKPCIKLMMHKCTMNNGNMAREFLPRGEKKKKKSSIHPVMKRVSTFERSDRDRERFPGVE